MLFALVFAAVLLPASSEGVIYALDGNLHIETPSAQGKIYLNGAEACRVVMTTLDPSQSSTTRIRATAEGNLLLSGATIVINGFVGGGWAAATAMR